MERVYKIGDLESVATELLQAMQGKSCIAFYGSMGAGKTTLIKVLCRLMGVEEEVNSPTFALVNEYEGRDGLIYHFDFYRIKSPQEALDLGLWDYLDSGCPCIMEWPECIEKLLPDDCLRINIENIDADTRRIRV